eukprot:scaffold175820_cov32-Tisochrysis_lutea.AAC.3
MGEQRRQISLPLREHLPGRLYLLPAKKHPLKRGIDVEAGLATGHYPYQYQPVALLQHRPKVPQSIRLTRLQGGQRGKVHLIEQQHLAHGEQQMATHSYHQLHQFGEVPSQCDSTA